MLTDEQRMTIRREESYRAEVRDELAARRRKGLLARVWGFLNSNLVVWFLGSVVATGIVISIDGRDQRKAVAVSKSWIRKLRRACTAPDAI